MLLTCTVCADVIDNFTTSFIDEMPVEELCSFCHVKWHQMMQTSPYSLYDKNYKSNLQRINSACDLTLPTAIPKLTLFENPHIEWDPYCTTHLSYTTSAGDTCDGIAAQFGVWLVPDRHVAADQIPGVDGSHEVSMGGGVSVSSFDGAGGAAARQFPRGNG